VDGDLVFAAVVEDLEVEGLVELGLEPGGCIGEDVAEQRERVEEGGVLAGGGGGEGVELGVDGGALFFEFAEAGDEPGAQRGDGGRSRGEGGEGFDFAGVGVLGGVDLPELLVEGVGVVLAARVGVVVVAGEGGGEEGGAVGAEDPLGEELGDDLEQVVFAEDDAAGVVGAGGGVAGVGCVVGAGVAGVGAAAVAGGSGLPGRPGCDPGAGLASRASRPAMIAQTRASGLGVSSASIAQHCPAYGPVRVSGHQISASGTCTRTPAVRRMRRSDRHHACPSV
jgi:hypothetical protein